MKAMRADSHQVVPWVRPPWWGREFDIRARDEISMWLSKEKGVGKTSDGALGQFARF